jgi:hypothetical protein
MRDLFEIPYANEALKMVPKQPIRYARKVSPYNKQALGMNKRERTGVSKVSFVPIEITQKRVHVFLSIKKRVNWLSQ